MKVSLYKNFQSFINNSKKFYNRYLINYHAILSRSEIEDWEELRKDFNELNEEEFT